MRIYGKVEFKDGQFLVQCEPHVAIRFKRVFGKVNSRQHGVLKLVATQDVARDLEWFIERFPLEFSEDARNAMEAKSAEHKERMAMVDAILSQQMTIPDFGLATPLREYQQIAAEIAYKRFCLLLADDVGLGKTASSIGLMARSGTHPVLVVTLTHLPRQWQEEIAKFAPHLSTHIIKTGKVYDIGSKRGLFDGLPNVIIISYSKLSKWADTLAPLVKTVIFDEVQELRKSDSQKSAAAHHIAQSCTWRMGLSATPIYNYGIEIWNVMQSLSPDSLGTKDEFITEWCTDSWQAEKAKIKNPSAFGSYMRESGLMLRRTRKDVGRELLPLNKVVEHIDADLDAIDQVSANCAELAKAILRQGEEFRGQKMQQSEEFSLKLRQATGIAKAGYVAEFVRILLEGEEKVVVYAWHREVYSILLDKLKEFNPVLYTGSESPSQKEASKERFCKGDSRVLLISLRAGAGLDGLQFVCRTVVNAEFDWSSGVHEQADGRVYRDGQTEPVFSYYLTADCGSDPIVTQILGIKKQQLEGIRNDQPGVLFEKLQNDTDRIKDLARDYLARHAKDKVSS